MADMLKPGANFSARRSDRRVVLEREVFTRPYRAFALRNVATGRLTHVSVHTLLREYSFAGFDA